MFWRNLLSPFVKTKDEAAHGRLEGSHSPHSQHCFIFSLLSFSFALKKEAALFT
jgi:hypothetical protein